MASTYATLSLEYLEENLHEVIGKNTIKIQKQNLLEQGKDTWMTVLYFENAHEETFTNYITYSKT